MTFPHKCTRTLIFEIPPPLFFAPNPPPFFCPKKKDFFQTPHGWSWLSRCEHLLSNLVSTEDKKEQGGKRAEAGSQGGQELVQPDTGILRLQHLLRDGLLLPAGVLQHTGGTGGTGAHEPSTGLSPGAAEEEHATQGQGGPGSAGKQAGGSARNQFLASVKAKVLEFLLSYLSKLQVPPQVCQY